VFGAVSPFLSDLISMCGKRYAERGKSAKSFVSWWRRHLAIALQRAVCISFNHRVDRLTLRLDRSPPHCRAFCDFMQTGGLSSYRL
jgi:hypothetical protein